MDGNKTERHQLNGSIDGRQRGLETLISSSLSDQSQRSPSGGPPRGQAQF
ncbi:uncharacterized protein V6R79_001193 [Siganus canaliculatus]